VLVASVVVGAELEVLDKSTEVVVSQTIGMRPCVIAGTNDFELVAPDSAGKNPIPAIARQTTSAPIFDLDDVAIRECFLSTENSVLLHSLGTIHT